MGLTTWRGAKVRKADVSIATNYLNAEELAALNNLVEQYLVFAEGQAMRRMPMHMGDWIAKLNGFLTINGRDILTHAGKISHDFAEDGRCPLNLAAAAVVKESLTSQFSTPEQRRRRQMTEQDQKQLGTDTCCCTG